MYSFASISLWHEVPLIGFCIFRVYSLFLVHKFCKILVLNEEINPDHSNGGNLQSNEAKYRKHGHKGNDDEDTDSDKVEVSTTGSSRKGPEANPRLPNNKSKQNNVNYSRNSSVNMRNHAISFSDEQNAPTPNPEALGLKIRKLSQVKTIDLPVLIFK
jgi:hypothetical protein